jgi:A-macroglobulin TED domain
MISLKYFYSSKFKMLNRTEINSLLEHAYGFILGRMNSDGSFSYQGFGKMESVWLTAHVVKCFNSVENVMTVNSTFIMKALEFLKRLQKPVNAVDLSQRNISGSFVEIGIQNKVDVLLTAHVAIAFLENSRFSPHFSMEIDKAFEFLDQNIASLTNAREKAVVTYAMALANHSSTNSLINELTEEGKRIWHENSEEELDDAQRMENIEVASYTILALLKANKELSAFPLVLWLVEQVKQSDGNFMLEGSVAPIQALTEVSKTFFNSKFSIKLNVTNHKKQISLKIDESTSPDTTFFNLPPNELKFHLDATGSGFAVLEVVLSYKTAIKEFKDKFSISVSTEIKEEILFLSVCVEVNADQSSDEENLEELGKLIMKVELPLGYVELFNCSRCCDVISYHCSYTFSPKSRNMLREIGVTVYALKINQKHVNATLSSSQKIDTLGSQNLLELHLKPNGENKVCPIIQAVRNGKTFEVKRKSRVTVHDSQGEPEKLSVFIKFMKL